MLENVRRDVRLFFEDLPRGLRVVVGIFAVLMWVLSAQFVAALVGLPLAELLGVTADGGLAVAYLGTFAFLVILPFLWITDWQHSRSLKNAVYIAAIMAWFVAADAIGDAGEGIGIPYVVTVSAVFLTPFLAYTVYRYREARDAREDE